MMTRSDRLDLLSWPVALGLLVAVAQPSSATVMIDTVTDAVKRDADLNSLALGRLCLAP